MSHNDYQYVFGPVPSRRLGRSLGIDLTPHKTCSLDCVFCQLGRTRIKTLERKVYVPTIDVMREIGRWLETAGDADYLTLSGSGEPTLHAEFGRVLAFLRHAPIPSALLTNGTLLHLPQVRASTALAKVVKISLSCWNQKSFERVNRPHRQLRFKTYFDGLKRFRKEFEGQLWLEVFVLAGINAMSGDVEKIAHLSRELKPDRIHLNTSVRPPAEDFAVAMPRDQLEELAGLFDPPAQIAAGFGTQTAKKAIADAADILSMLKRRPCTIRQLAEAFASSSYEVVKYLSDMVRSGEIAVRSADNQLLIVRANPPMQEKRTLGREPVIG